MTSTMSLAAVSSSISVFADPKAGVFVHASQNRLSMATSSPMTSSFSGRKLKISIQKSIRPASRTVPVQASAERSYVMIKPDGVQRGLVGEIIGRFEAKGFSLKGLKLFQTPEELAKEHYKDLASKPFYNKLVEYIISGPVVAMIWEGPNVVSSARKLIGATNPLTAEPGTIRGDLAIEVGRNVVHGSDSVENGAREIGLWFDEDEICEWVPTIQPWLIE